MAAANKKAVSIRTLVFSAVVILAAILFINLKAFVFSAILIAAICAFAIYQNRNWRIRQKTMEEKRGALNIGDFTKEFNIREISTVAIRYIFDRLTEMNITANVLSSDHLLQMYRIDSDELVDIILDFIDRFSIDSHILEDIGEMKIETVADLVEFIDQIYKKYVKNPTI